MESCNFQTEYFAQCKCNALYKEMEQADNTVRKTEYDNILKLEANTGKMKMGKFDAHKLKIWLKELCICSLFSKFKKLDRKNPPCVSHSVLIQ